MPYSEFDLPKWVNVDHLMKASDADIQEMVTSANENLPAFIARLSRFGLNKKSAHVSPSLPSAHRASAAPSGGGGGGAVPSSRCLGSICGGHGVIARAGACDRCLVAMEASDKRREREADDKARREIEEADRRRRAADARRERELADAIEAAEIAEAEERRQRNAREIGVQLVGSRHLDANSREANRQVDIRRAAQQQADPHVVRIHHMPPGSLGGQVIVHHHGGGGAPIAVGINGVPRAVFGPPMINPFPFAMPGFGARHF